MHAAVLALESEGVAPGSLREGVKQLQGALSTWESRLTAAMEQVGCLERGCRAGGDGW